MASGFETDHGAMAKAIRESTATGVIIFDAASNYGNIHQIIFPRRMRDVLHIFCIDAYTVEVV